jgi:hypothetical protein
MVLFWQRDWNIVAITFESTDRLRLNGNREKGKRALEAKKGAASHAGTICWAVFDQSGKQLDSGLGPAAKKLQTNEAQQILERMPTHRDVLKVLHDLEQGRARAASSFHWKE